MGKTNSRRHKRNGAPLLTLAIILLIAGSAAIFAPMAVTEMELYLDTEAYEQLKEQSRMVTPTSDPAQMPNVALNTSSFILLAGDWPDA